MAHVYTTARGKTKKAKETQRKDAKNNAANKLMARIVKAPVKAQANLPNKDFLDKLSADVNGMKTIEGSGRTRLFKTPSPSTPLDDEAFAQAVKNVRIQLPSYQRCFFELCTSPPEGSVYKHCSRCRIARYCSADCQKGDWHKVHKMACCKSELLSIGCSVAFRPLEAYLSLISPTLYPSALCIPPSNELHGVIVSLPSSLQAPSTSIAQPTPSTVRVEIFDCELVPSGKVIEVSTADLVASGWDLKGEGEERKRRREDRRKDEERRAEEKIKAEEEEKAYQEAKAEKRRKLMEKKKKEMEEQAKNGKIEIDWDLFNEELDNELNDLANSETGDYEEEEEEDEENE